MQTTIDLCHLETLHLGHDLMSMVIPTPSVQHVVVDGQPFLEWQGRITGQHLTMHVPNGSIWEVIIIHRFWRVVLIIIL